MPKNPSARPTFWARQSLVGKSLIALFMWPTIAGTIIAMLFADIIPTSGVLKVAIALSIVYAMAWSVFMEIANRGKVWNRGKKGSAILRRPWLRVPFTLCIGFMFGYSSFAWTYPWLYTKVAGVTKSEEFVVTGWDSGGRRSCSRPEIGHALFQDSPGALCVSSDARNQMPPGTHLRVVGPQTILGINTDKIYILKRAKRMSGIESGGI